MKIGRDTLTSVPDSRLAAMFAGSVSSNYDKEGRIFIDRNPDIFKHVIDYLTSNQQYLLNTQDKNIKTQLDLEIQYWNISELKYDQLLHQASFKKLN